MKSRRNYEIDWVNLTIDEAQNILYKMIGAFDIYENILDEEETPIINLHIKDIRKNPFEKGRV